MINACVRANAQYEPLRPGQLHCVIVGAGATGVELVAELHKTMRDMAAYGLDKIDFDKSIKLTIMEAGPRILGPLPEPLANVDAGHAQAARHASADWQAGGRDHQRRACGSPATNSSRRKWSSGRPESRRRNF